MKNPILVHEIIDKTLYFIYKGGPSGQMTWQFLNALLLFLLKKTNYPIFVFV